LSGFSAFFLSSYNVSSIFLKSLIWSASFSVSEFVLILKGVNLRRGQFDREALYEEEGGVAIPKFSVEIEVVEWGSDPT
jgi:hypothetical protein